jgi:predicted enzyme related to lactoylglutathione lyase
MSDKIFTRGRFVWHDYMAKDPAKARAFYTELMAWKIDEMDMGPMGKYAMLKRGDAGIGGIVPLTGAPAEVPSHWISYISVDDVDATCKKAKELGGKVCVEAFDIPGVGRTAVLEDPTGAVFSPFKSADGEPPITERPAVGEFCWFEVMTTDVAKTKNFYAGLFGWTYEKAPFPGPEMWIASRDGKQTCAVMAKPAEAPVCAWMNYLLVEDLDQSSKRAEQLGGKKLMGPIEVPTIGKFNVFADNNGGVISLFQGSM